MSTYTRTTSDSIALTSTAGLRAFDAYAAGSVALTDGNARYFQRARLIADVLTLLEASVGAKSKARSMADVLTATDASAGSKVKPRLVSDSIELVAGAGTRAFDVYAAAALTLLDTLSAITSGRRVTKTATDTLTTLDGSTWYMVRARAVVEALAAVDASLVSRLRNRATSDGFTLLDVLVTTAARVTNATVTETLTVTETGVERYWTVYHLDDAVALVDAITAVTTSNHLYTKLVTELFSLSDSSARSVRRQRSLADIVALIDSSLSTITNVHNQNVVVTEGMTVADYVTARLPLRSRVVTDTLLTADQLAAVLAFVVVYDVRAQLGSRQGAQLGATDFVQLGAHD